MRLLLDVNMSPLWIDYLRAAGHEAVHWRSVGDVRAADTEIVAHARANGYVIFTRDLDFGAMLAASGDERPSVIQLRGPSQLPARIGPQVLRVLEQSAAELAAGAFVTMNLTRTRLTILPLYRQ